MDAKELIQMMMEDSGIGSNELSRAMGKSNGFISATLSKNSTPRLDTFAKMADIMGFEVVIKKKNEEIVYVVIDSQASDSRAEK